MHIKDNVSTTNSTDLSSLSQLVYDTTNLLSPTRMKQEVLKGGKVWHNAMSNRTPFSQTRALASDFRVMTGETMNILTSQYNSAYMAGHHAVVTGELFSIKKNLFPILSYLYSQNPYFACSLHIY